MQLCQGQSPKLGRRIRGGTLGLLTRLDPLSTYQPTTQEIYEEEMPAKTNTPDSTLRGAQESICVRNTRNSLQA